MLRPSFKGHKGQLYVFRKRKQQNSDSIKYKGEARYVKKTNTFIYIERGDAMLRYTDCLGG